MRDRLNSLRPNDTYMGHQIWVKYWFVTYSVPSHYLNQHWLIVNWIRGNIFHWNLNQNATIFMEENEFVVCNTAAIVSRHQYVKTYIWSWQCSANMQHLGTACLLNIQTLLQKAVGEACGLFKHTAKIYHIYTHVCCCLLWRKVHEEWMVQCLIRCVSIESHMPWILNEK